MQPICTALHVKTLFLHPFACNSAEQVHPVRKRPESPPEFLNEQAFKSVTIGPMVKRLCVLSGFTGLYLILAAAPLVRAQAIDFPPLPGWGPEKQKKILDEYPEKPSLPPAFSIPVGPLGFSAPGPFYPLRRQSLVSLDFLDENRILFTFRVAGMIQRTDTVAEGDQQRIRAVVLALPDGKVESKADWIVPDRARYLWALKDGHFLLRLREGLDQGDTALKLTPYLRLPGQLLWLEMDPAQQVVITNSLEPVTAAQSSGPSAPPATTQVSMAIDGQKADPQKVLVARTLQRESGQVMHVSQIPWTRQTQDWPMNSKGYLERSQAGRQWLLKLNSFDGEPRVLARLDSSCPPTYSFISERNLFVTTCDPEAGGWKLAALTGNDERLWHVWEKKAAWNAIWPLLVMAPDGSAVARETLLLKRAVNKYKRPLGTKDIEGQMVTVYDAADGKVLLQAPLTPMLDAGGNVAISPSGRRVAILNAGAIQVFQLSGNEPH
jgi:hypothetical protein